MDYTVHWILQARILEWLPDLSCRGSFQPRNLTQISLIAGRIFYQLSYQESPKILKDDAIKMLHSISQQIWKIQQWPQKWKRSTHILIPKRGSTEEHSNHQTIVLISDVSRVMFKILQAKLQNYLNWEFPDVQAGFSKGRWTRDQIARIRWIIEKSREFQKRIYLFFINYAKAFDHVYHKKL